MSQAARASSAWLFETSATADDVNAALDAAGLEFVELIQSAPRVALPKSHPW